MEMAMVLGDQTLVPGSDHGYWRLDQEMGCHSVWMAPARNCYAYKWEKNPLNQYETEKSCKISCLLGYDDLSKAC
ncbi:hypothetical protein A2U01_0012091 [Trifolium medium]|uniref:Uncharacterized protein n=1 Tax=Trifolium medium TaxID=97028 RepID=A0A392MVY2_9FABA|nr:hypothetical protein [Trifolium medium]